ncbi:DUF2946 domain-containing protein [Enterobacteriaceae bacterium LUAb1]
MARQISTVYIAAWLALLAVIMLFVAPVISKFISHKTVCEHAVSAMNLSDTHQNMMTKSCQTAAEMDHCRMSRQVMSPMEEIACGYCQLLIHLPFVLFMLTALLWLLLFFIHCMPLSRPLSFSAFRIWTSQHIRAPPLGLSLQSEYS